MLSCIVSSMSESAFQVCAGAEYVSVSGKDNAADAIVVLDVCEYLQKLVQHSIRERIVAARAM